MLNFNNLKNKNGSSLLKVSFILISMLLAMGVMVSAYNQAPELKEKVNSGELPPLEERLPKNPRVEELDKVGQYGGTLNRIFSGTTNLGPLEQSGVVTQADHWVYVSSSLDVQPRIIESWEWVSQDPPTFRIHLREGIKWSDGHPLTADDIIYALNAIEEVPFKGGGQLSNVLKDWEKQSQYVIDLYPKEPYPQISLWMREAPVAPKHYLTQFDPRFDSDKSMQDLETAWASGMERITESLVDLPTLCPWKVSEVILGQKVVLERNPYYYAVDKEGNQLPYIDKLVYKQVEDANQSAPGLAKGGEIDFQTRHILIDDYMFYRQNEEAGNFRVIPLKVGSLAPAFNFNYGVEDEQLREMFWDKDFRKALSHALNRKRISENIYFGETEAYNHTALRGSPVFPGEKYAKMYTEYKPDMAKELLKELGLVDRNGDGWREFPNGDTLEIVIDYSVDGIGGPPSMAEIVSEMWREVGLKVQPNPIKLTLMQSRWDNNSWQMDMWRVDTAIMPIGRKFFWMADQNPDGNYSNLSFGQELAVWYDTNGEKGVEPPESVKELTELWNKANASLDREKMIEYGTQHAKVAAESLLWIPTTTNLDIAIANKDLVTHGTWRFTLLAGGLNEAARMYTFFYKNPSKHN